MGTASATATHNTTRARRRTVTVLGGPTELGGWFAGAAGRPGVAGASADSGIAAGASSSTTPHATGGSDAPPSRPDTLPPLMPALGPRLVIAGTQSGVGKTTVATGVMAALRATGLRVGAAKVGPDFIDPGYHSVATGRPGRNLDAWICGLEAMGPLAARAADACDILVIEGVMGLFDGAGGWDPGGPAASTAELAAALAAPVVLVVDASAMGESVAAVVHGYASHDPAVRLAGVVLNRVASESHEQALRAALAPLGIPVVGVLRRGAVPAWRDRHLGLVPVAEQPAEVRRSVLDLAAAVKGSCDLGVMVALAKSAPAIDAARPPAARPVARARVAVAAGSAFSFTYADNLEALAAAGAELVPFDPRSAPALPVGVEALYAGGGFPEVFADELAANLPLLDDVRAHVASGRLTWAECGGLLWLAESMDGRPMAGALRSGGRMTDRLTLGYRRARVLADSPFGPAATELRGHEFHYSTLEPPGAGMSLTGRSGTAVAGHVSKSLFASYLHLHLGAAPELAERFVACAAAVRR